MRKHSIAQTNLDCALRQQYRWPGCTKPFAADAEAAIISGTEELQHGAPQAFEAAAAGTSSYQAIRPPITVQVRATGIMAGVPLLSTAVLRSTFQHDDAVPI